MGKEQLLKTAPLWTIAVLLLLFIASYIQLNNEWIKETKRHNTFQRRLAYDNSIVEKEMRCKELAETFGLTYELYYDIRFKSCSPNFEREKGFFGGFTEKGYHGRFTEEYVQGYQDLFRGDPQLPQE